jgi:hypothetical protein
MPAPTTRIAHHDAKAIYIRGASLVDDLIGKLTFTEMMYFQLMGERATPAQAKVLDAVLVTLMEHGITPSAIVSRLIYDSCPEACRRRWRRAARRRQHLHRHHGGLREDYRGILAGSKDRRRRDAEQARARRSRSVCARRSSRFPASATRTTSPTIRARRA